MDECKDCVYFDSDANLCCYELDEYIYGQQQTSPKFYGVDPEDSACEKFIRSYK